MAEAIILALVLLVIVLFEKLIGGEDEG